MKKNKWLILILLIFLTSVPYAQTYKISKDIKEKYIQLSGNLFRDVQLAGIFKDSKTFVDAVPKMDPGEISRLYDSLKTMPDFALSQFVYKYFSIPGERMIDSLKMPPLDLSMGDHIDSLWNYLIRKPDPENQYSTLLPLKHPYIVPGGRFREIYYWDSFFTILGLLADNKVSIAENMVLNFADLVKNYKMIPNGNRIYYLSRSQPPFFSLMVDIICRYKNDYNWGLQFLDQLETEYIFWMDGLNNITESSRNVGSENVVKLDKNIILNRYYDYDNVPREESFKEDFSQAQKIPDTMRQEFFRNLRSAAESGWDFSSRWFKDGNSLLTIQTTDILPVDLNCLLYFLEERLSYFFKLDGKPEKSIAYDKRAKLRSELINKIFWNEKEGFYFDYNWKTKTHTMVYSLSSVFPLYFKIASEAQAKKVAKKIRTQFLKPGGLVTTLYETKQQWDAPNGWPPLQWITIKGLREYNMNLLADEIKKRWLSLNMNVYKRTGKMFEKYNVEDLRLFAGGGEYPTQDGFGWTNGVAAALIKDFDRTFLSKNLKK